MLSEEAVTIVVSVSFVQIVFFVATIAILWQDHLWTMSQFKSLRAEIRAMNSAERLQSAELGATSDRLGAVETDRARLDGMNEAMLEILRRQSHTHESDH